MARELACRAFGFVADATGYRTTFAVSGLLALVAVEVLRAARASFRQPLSVVT